MGQTFLLHNDHRHKSFVNNNKHTTESAQCDMNNMMIFNNIIKYIDFEA